MVVDAGRTLAVGCSTGVAGSDFPQAMASGSTRASAAGWMR
jgi:hypothetical protein